MKKIFRIFKEFNKADQHLNASFKEKRPSNRKDKQLQSSEKSEDLGGMISNIYK